MRELMVSNIFIKRLFFVMVAGRATTAGASNDTEVKSVPSVTGGQRYGVGENSVDQTPPPTASSNVGLCEDSIETLLSPAMEKCLAVANDASSSVDPEAFYAMQSLTGYPGQIGFYDECSKVILFDESSPPSMETHHCLAGSLSLASNEATVPFGGLCVPEACTPDDLSSSSLRSWLTQRAAAMEASGTSTSTQAHFVKNLLQQTQLAADMKRGLTCGTYRKESFGWDAWAVIAGLSMLLAFIVYATWMDLTKSADYAHNGEKMLNAPQRIKYSGSNDENGLYVLQEDQVSKYLAAFSVARNLSRLFSVGEPNELSVLNGLRVLSMLWVVLGHILAVQTSLGYVNPEAVYPPDGLVASMLGQMFFSARFAVDTFFFVSGFLVVYAMLRRFKSEGHGVKINKIWTWLPCFYLHRLLRIAPAYLFSMLVWWKLAVFMGGGPFWYRWEYLIGLCDRFWWSNVLFVNNLVPWHAGEIKQCFSPSWYLANDMQFYLLSPVFVVVYMRRRVLGILIALSALLASTVAMAVGTYLRGWSALTLDGSWVVLYSEETYTAPYFRIVPYLGGMVFAMLWQEKQIRHRHFKLTDGQLFLLLSLAIALLTAVTFAGYSGYQRYPCSVDEDPVDGNCGSGWGRGALATYNAGTRPAWCLGLGLLCFVCFNRQGGLVQQVLAHPAWVPLARLSFGAYLLHPLVINLWFLNSTRKFHFSGLDLVMSYVCATGVTFGSSLVMMVIIESPMTKLGRHLERVLRPRQRVHEASVEFFAGERCPVSMERHVLNDSGADDFLSTQDQDLLLSVDGASSSLRSSLSVASNGGTPRAGGAVSTTKDELAALLASTNPGYRDYMTQGLRRGSEAFG